MRGTLQTPGCRQGGYPGSSGCRAAAVRWPLAMNRCRSRAPCPWAVVSFLPRLLPSPGSVLCSDGVMPLGTPCQSKSVSYSLEKANKDTAAHVADGCKPFLLLLLLLLLLLNYYKIIFLL